MNKATLQTIIEDRIFNLVGNSFQDLCDRLCLKLYPDDYTPVRAGGPKGDTKNDGYCPKAKIYFAAHATMGYDRGRFKSVIMYRKSVGFWQTQNGGWSWAKKCMLEI
jgi:hypothetical protein